MICYENLKNLRKHWRYLNALEQTWFIEKILPREKIKIVGQCQSYGFNENEWKYICSQCSSLNFLGFHKIKLELTLSLHLHMYPIFLLLRTYPFFLMYTSPPPPLSHMHILTLIMQFLFIKRNIFLTSSISFKTKNWISVLEASFFGPHDHYYYSLDLVKSSSAAAVTAGQRASQILP